MEYVGGVKWPFLTKSRNERLCYTNISAGFTLSNMWRLVGSFMPSLCSELHVSDQTVNKSFDSFLGTFFFHNESKKLVNCPLHVNKTWLDTGESRKVIISCCSCWCLLPSHVKYNHKMTSSGKQGVRYCGVSLPIMMETCGSETFSQMFFLQAKNQWRAAESDVTDVG